jgi:hypothetical protein
MLLFLLQPRSLGVNLRDLGNLLSLGLYAQLYQIYIKAHDYPLPPLWSHVNLDQGSRVVQDPMDHVSYQDPLMYQQM